MNKSNSFVFPLVHVQRRLQCLQFNTNPLQIWLLQIRNDPWNHLTHFPYRYVDVYELRLHHVDFQLQGNKVYHFMIIRNQHFFSSFVGKFRLNETNMNWAEERKRKEFAYLARALYYRNSDRKSDHCHREIIHKFPTNPRYKQSHWKKCDVQYSLNANNDGFRFYRKTYNWL